MRNPFGMDEGCTNCDALTASRQHIVHGYGDVTAEFVFVRESPTPAADTGGHPLADGDPLRPMLERAGFLPGETDDEGVPVLDNAFLTHITRCRHPERPATAEEVRACDPFLTAEIRSINPEIIIPVGQRALVALGDEYLSTSLDDLDVDAVHAESIRGRGFEILPLRGNEERTEADIAAFLDALDATMGRDYRQTKGRRRR